MKKPSNPGASLVSLFDRGFNDHAAVIANCGSLVEPFTALVASAVQSLKDGGKILLFGNGGSAADAQHIAAELTIRYSRDRPALAAIALTTDSSALTACGNDMGFEQIFARQMEALGRPEDTVIGISTSGRSRNVILALQAASRLGARTFAFTGESGGDLNDLCNGILRAPSRVTARIQEVHILLGHLLCEGIEAELGYGAQE